MQSLVFLIFAVCCFCLKISPHDDDDDDNDNDEVDNEDANDDDGDLMMATNSLHLKTTFPILELNLVET